MAAFDPDIHVIDEKGFQRHKETGHLVGIEGAPPAKHPNHGAEYPKWVAPHPNHIVRQGANHLATPQFAHNHVNRVDSEVTVLVDDAEEEAFALADPRAPKAA